MAVGWQRGEYLLRQIKFWLFEILYESRSQSPFDIGTNCAVAFVPGSQIKDG
jgi:hypothetical protein